MRKFRLQISVLACLHIALTSSAQNDYLLHVDGVDKDSTTIISLTGIQTKFFSREASADYISKLPALLFSKGFVTASIDSIAYNTSYATVSLFLGDAYQWAKIDVSQVEPAILEAVRWRDKAFPGKPIDFTQVKILQENILTHLENNGYPFAKVYLDEIDIIQPEGTGANTKGIAASLVVIKNHVYKIDSIRVYGDAKISNQFLQRYLDLRNGSIYKKDKLMVISKRLRELVFVEEQRPGDLTMLGTGSVLNLYLRHKRSSQVNILIGFLPNNNQLAASKLLVTGEGNILLRNSFGRAETIGINFQALQVKSQRINIMYQHPYISNTPLGLDFYFDMLRKDSSFVNVNIQLGALYMLNINETAKIFYQKSQTIVSQGGVNTSLVIQSKRLPDVADINMNNIGLDYELNKTDYRLNPRKGHEIHLITTIGTKKIKKNNEILALKDPADPAYDFERLYDTINLDTYQFRIKAMTAKYFPLGNQRSTVKTAVNAGMLQSGSIYRNELFQLGGFKLLRGFDEESQYLSEYAIATVEYRYLVGQNSFFYVLADGGWGRDNRQRINLNYSFFGTGLGLAFETRAGIFNLAWAVGKRNDSQFNLRQSKIHFGFVNYF